MNKKIKHKTVDLQQLETEHSSYAIFFLVEYLRNI